MPRVRVEGAGAASVEEALEHLRSVTAAVALPVNADFEGGFAVEPERVAENVALAVGTGVALAVYGPAEAAPRSPLVR